MHSKNIIRIKVWNLALGEVRHSTNYISEKHEIQKLLHYLSFKIELVSGDTIIYRKFPTQRGSKLNQLADFQTQRMILEPEN